MACYMNQLFDAMTDFILNAWQNMSLHVAASAAAIVAVVAAACFVRYADDDEDAPLPSEPGAPEKA